MQKQFFSLASTVLLTCSLAMLTACNSSSSAESGDTPTPVLAAQVDTEQPLITPAPFYPLNRTEDTPVLATQADTPGGIIERPLDITSYPVCTHQLGEPEPYPVIDSNTGKPLDLQPYVASYPCIEPGDMTICSHQPGEPNPLTQYDASTNKPLDPQPYVQFYYCFAKDITRAIPPVYVPVETTYTEINEPVVITVDDSNKQVYAPVETTYTENATDITSYPVCTHQLGEPEPYPAIDNNTGKPLDLQPYVASYPCIEPGAMTVCSHQPGEPDPLTQYDASTNKPLDPQPYVKFYYCFAHDITRAQP